MASKKLVRIKPYDKRRGHLLRTYRVGGKFYEGKKGWYEIEASVAEVLAEVKQSTDPHAPNGFDICTRAEAERIDEEEAQEEGKRSASSPNKFTAREDVEAKVKANRARQEKAKAQEAARAARATEEEAELAELEAEEIAAEKAAQVQADVAAVAKAEEAAQADEAEKAAKARALDKAAEEEAAAVERAAVTEKAPEPASTEGKGEQEPDPFG